MAQDTQITFVVPAHNSEPVLESTWHALRERLPADAEVVAVENGSTDETWQILQEIAADRGPDDPELQILRSEKGLGNALRTGILASSGERLVLTADDLPFGFSDLSSYEKLQSPSPVVVGSKAHPDSVVPRGTGRGIMSAGFRGLRRMLLSSRTGDSQGTLLVDADFARKFAEVSQESGYLWSTELIYAAECAGLPVQEVPVVLSEAHDAHATRVRTSDVTDMIKGLARLRRRRDIYAELA